VRRLRVTGDNPPRDRHFLLAGQQRGLADLEEILVQDVAFRFEGADGLASVATGTRQGPPGAVLILLRLFAHGVRITVETNVLAHA
jgi:hypothetical protein